MAISQKRCVFCNIMLTAREASAGYVCGSLACGWQLTSRPQEKRCAICGTLLSPLELKKGICADNECQNSALLQRMAVAAREKAAHDRRVAEARRLRAAEYRDGCAERAGVSDAESFVVTVIPLNKASEGLLPDERRELFRARLASVVADAQLRRSTRQADDAPQLPYIGRPASAETQAVMLNACMLCRGNCCLQGGNHAFIGWNTVLRYMDSNPEQHADDVIGSYMSHVGDHTLLDGCVYQGVGGCTLPRDMRSDTCNNFLCSGLHTFLDAVDHGALPKAFVVPFRDQEFDHGMFATGELVQIVRVQGVGIT